MAYGKELRKQTKVKESMSTYISLDILNIILFYMICRVKMY